eukprot:CAMPEP_0180787082 /NCGR_PEP_ID=MMETSP1038_2-20121128/51182_1 /TAXON_ID=632150 /ORGANISM="Azadinium spinosum, Strain 3D9" /LENGTH=156 /DNA_ID=CAMNT_0022824323 /DNA_START=317 /DNA_END=788 /DNA_ORIENTATION=+
MNKRGALGASARGMGFDNALRCRTGGPVCINCPCVHPTAWPCAKPAVTHNRKMLLAFTSLATSGVCKNTGNGPWTRGVHVATSATGGAIGAIGGQREISKPWQATEQASVEPLAQATSQHGHGAFCIATQILQRLWWAAKDLQGLPPSTHLVSAND